MRTQENFYAELNRKTVEAVQKDAAFFMRPQSAPVSPIYDNISGHPVTGANYFYQRISNDLNNINNSHKPSPVDGYIPFQSNNVPVSNFNDFVLEQCTNAINASFTNCAFKSNIPENNLSTFKAMLINEIAKKPAFIAEIANKAHQNVMDYHYIPFDKKSFIEKARNEHSDEFRRLHSSISDHVNDMYTYKRPSFNPAFDELSRPLILNSANARIDSFLREKIMQDSPASILADVFAGTRIEKAIKLARAGKKIFSAFMLAGSLLRAQKEMDKYRFPGTYSNDDKIIINNRVFRGDDLRKILNFDNAPFPIDGRGNPEKRDYMAAHLAEKSIIESITNINYDEYRRDMTYNQMTSLHNTIARKTGVPPDMNTNMRIIDNIAAIQERNGNTMLNSFRDTNPRMFYTCINQTIREQPQVLDQAIARIHKQSNHISQSRPMSRRRGA